MQLLPPQSPLTVLLCRRIQERCLLEKVFYPLIEGSGTLENDVCLVEQIRKKILSMFRDAAQLLNHSCQRIDDHSLQLILHLFVKCRAADEDRLYGAFHKRHGQSVFLLALH